MAILSDWRDSNLQHSEFKKGTTPWHPVSELTGRHHHADFPQKLNGKKPIAIAVRTRLHWRMLKAIKWSAPVLKMS